MTTTALRAHLLSESHNALSTNGDLFKLAALRHATEVYEPQQVKLLQHRLEYLATSLHLQTDIISNNCKEINTLLDADTTHDPHIVKFCLPPPSPGQMDPDVPKDKLHTYICETLTSICTTIQTQLKPLCDITTPVKHLEAWLDFVLPNKGGITFVNEILKLKLTVSMSSVLLQGREPGMDHSIAVQISHILEDFSSRIDIQEIVRILLNILYAYEDLYKANAQFNTEEIARLQALADKATEGDEKVTATAAAQNYVLRPDQVLLPLGFEHISVTSDTLKGHIANVQKAFLRSSN